MAGLVVLAGLVGASPAQADGYSVDVTITASPNPVKEHKNVKISADASPGVDCDWTLTYRGQTATEEDGGSSTSHTFNAGNEGNHTAKAVCKYSGTDSAFPIPEALGGFGGAGRIATAVADPVHTSSASTVVHVIDGKDGNGNGNGHHHKKHHKKHDGDDNGHLPNTGGERLAWLVIGLLLVAAGTTVVVSSRKRETTV